MVIIEQEILWKLPAPRPILSPSTNSVTNSSEGMTNDFVFVLKIHELLKENE